jgi:acyl-CoA reductase-like NAD-dependent aldehyde dehydrogenase
MAETVDALRARLAREVVGDGLADEVTMGPVHTAGARDRVETFIAEASAAGAPVHRPGRLRAEDESSGGYFVSPALVEAPPARSAIVREEQFAPALPVIPYDDLGDAIAAANDTTFGLCASVWSNDDALTADVAARLDAGIVWINAHGMSAVDMYAPMGGWKQSGFGVELGTEGMQAFARQRVQVRRPGPAQAGGAA